MVRREILWREGDGQPGVAEEVEYVAFRKGLLMEEDAKEFEVTPGGEERKTRYQRHLEWKERTTMLYAGFIGGALVLFSLVMLALPGSPPEAKVVADKILVALGGAVAGYTFRSRRN